ncbi:hypothetical protein [Pelobium manganitolerans]
MKKLALSIFTAVILLGSSSAFAGNGDDCCKKDATCCKAKQECCKK